MKKKSDFYHLFILTALSEQDTEVGINYYDNNGNIKSWEEVMLQRDIAGLKPIPEPADINAYMRTMNWKAWMLGFIKSHSTNYDIVNAFEYALKQYAMFDFNNEDDNDLIKYALTDYVRGARDVGEILVDFILKKHPDAPCAKVAMQYAMTFCMSTMYLDELMYLKRKYNI